jgi:hypothetical protein
MYVVQITISNQDGAPSREFDSAANIFLDKLSSVSGLEVDIPKEEVEGSRGDISLLTGIIVTGINLGLFSAIYTLGKDLFALYANAEVELQFQDGSKLTLKNLSREEAEKAISEHIRKAASSK